MLQSPERDATNQNSKGNSVWTALREPGAVCSVQSENISITSNELWGAMGIIGEQTCFLIYGGSLHVLTKLSCKSGAVIVEEGNLRQFLYSCFDLPPGRSSV